MNLCLFYSPPGHTMQYSETGPGMVVGHDVIAAMEEIEGTREDE